MKKESLKNTDKNQKHQEYVDLINIIKKSKNKTESNIAFESLEKLLYPLIQNVIYKFNIPGYSKQDIYQEALYALRYKAIKDYNKDKSTIDEIAPFQKFAALCIKRHLSTKLKSSFQNKSKTLNTSISTSIKHNSTDNGNDDNIIDISAMISDDSITVLHDLHTKEFYKTIFSGLINKLSEFERKIIILYSRKLSYQEMCDYLNLKKKEDQKIDIRSIDNALMRIKSKAKNIINDYDPEYLKGLKKNKKAKEE